MAAIATTRSSQAASHALRIQQLSIPSSKVVSTFNHWSQLSLGFYMLSSTMNLPPQTTNIYRSAYETSQAFIRQCGTQNQFHADQHWELCYDSDRNLQGAMFLSPAYASNPIYCDNYRPYMVVELLMTHPLNIDSPLAATVETVRGVGRALIGQAQKICVADQADGLVSRPDPSSTVFWQKLGFHQDGDFMLKKSSEFDPAPHV